MKTEILNYVRESYIEEHQRYDHIENKCTRVLGPTVILITGIITFLSKGLFSPKGLLDWPILILIILSVFLLIGVINPYWKKYLKNGVDVVKNNLPSFKAMLTHQYFLQEAESAFKLFGDKGGNRIKILLRKDANQ